MERMEGGTTTAATKDRARALMLARMEEQTIKKRRRSPMNEIEE